MKKIIISVIGFLLSISLLYCQRFGLAGSCQINVNNSNYHYSSHSEAIDATVKIVFLDKYGSAKSWCTGTLINRAVGDRDLGFYLLTANHCIRENNGFGNIDVDFNAYHYIIFNYQSPDALNESTKSSNRGLTYNQSIAKSGTGSDGYEYLHKSKLRLVESKKWGDFALLEILTPVPPHFNVAYAGWNPSKFGYPPTETIVGIHHPRGDIKKISGIPYYTEFANPVSSSCYFVTTIIDVLFGWIWGRTTSTKTVCKWLDIPYFSVPYYTFGTVEKGSSGSGMFDFRNNLYGMLSFGLSSCSFYTNETYGAFYVNYPNSSIKNTLNPYHNNAVDLWGLDSRRITIYDNLILPGGDGTNGYYFPANHYHAENKIVLKARYDIQTKEPITVFEGADYEFVAGNSITIGPGFTVQPGANFRAYISPQGPKLVKEKQSDPNQILIDQLEKIVLPPFSNKPLYIQQKMNFKVYPNPANDIINIQISNDIESIEMIEIISITGQSIHKIQSPNALETINMNNFPDGVYIVKIINKENQVDSEKIIVRR